MKWLNYTLALSALLLLMVTVTLPDNLLHVYFCDVGQGDGALITQGLTQIIIDAGPDNGKFVQCLANHIPFYDHTIELAIGTHPQADHEGGYTSVLQRYTILQFVTTKANNPAKFFQDLKKQLANVKYINTGDRINIGELSLLTIWPTADFVAAHDDAKTDLNQFALVQKLSYGDMDILFTAGADQPTEDGQLATRLLGRVEVLKVPHHGSKTGMHDEWLNKIHPQMAVISVGAKNTYGHPTQEALDLLTKYKIKILRTDQAGTIQVTSDGHKWWL